jgi:hypothetical protein
MLARPKSPLSNQLGFLVIIEVELIMQTPAAPD